MDEQIFLGWYATAKQDPLTLVKQLEDSLLRINMNLTENCVGQTLDGAATMVGRLSGMKTRNQSKFPKALFVYCTGHVLNRVITRVIDDIPACKTSMAVVGSIAPHGKPRRPGLSFKMKPAQSDGDDGDQTESEHSDSDSDGEN